MLSSRRQFLITSSTLLLTVGLPGAAQAEAGYVLLPVVGPNTPLSDVSLGLLRRVFLGEAVDGPNGIRFVGFNHPPKTRARTLFDQVVLGMHPDEAARYWVDQRIRGGPRPPRVVPNVPLLRQVVSQFPGAIAYLPAGDVDASVRVLTVNGGDSNSVRYPLR